MWFNLCICCTLYMLLPSPVLNFFHSKRGRIYSFEKNLELVTVKCCNSGVKFQRTTVWLEDTKMTRDVSNKRDSLSCMLRIVGWPKIQKNQMLGQYDFSYLLLHPFHRKLFTCIQRLCSMKTILLARLQSTGFVTSAVKKWLRCSFDNSKFILKCKENQLKKFWSKSHWL